MEELFLHLANYSLVAGYVVLAILAVRLFIRKAPKWLICLMWSLVAIRLIFPFSVESTLSLIPSAEPIPQNIIYSANPTVNLGITVLDNSINPILSETLEPEPFASANPTQIFVYIASRIWIIGVSIMIVYALVSSFLLVRRLSTATLLQKGVKQSDRVESPFVFGIIRPVIYLPYEMSEDDLTYVLAHERAHIRRKDHLWKPIGFLLLSVYWFNPILWIAYICLCRDIEAACDEKVIKDMELDERKAYSMALLHCSIHSRMMITACPIAFGENSVKTRIKNVMNYKKPAFWIMIISIVALIGGGVCFLTNPKSKELPSDVEDEKITEQVEKVIEENESASSTISQEIFDDLSGEYWFLSGAGAWQTRLFLYNDGTFCGFYQDADTNTVYRCVFQGSLELPTVIDDYTLCSRILNISYEEPGFVKREGENVVITSGPYGLENAESIYFYLPGYPISDLSESEYLWLSAEREEFWDINQKDASGMSLPCYAIRNTLEDGEYIFAKIPDSFISDKNVPSFAEYLDSAKRYEIYGVMSQN